MTTSTISSSSGLNDDGTSGGTIVIVRAKKNKKKNSNTIPKVMLLFQSASVMTTMIGMIFLQHICVCCSAHRIAIIGGGLTGTFVAKYLTDLEKDCSIQSLTIFDPHPILGDILVVPDGTVSNLSASTDYPPSGSHLLSYRLEDNKKNDKNGQVFEVGTSILSERYFPLVTAMVKSDRRNQLQVQRPIELGGTTEHNTMNDSIKILVHNGKGNIAFQVNIDNTTTTTTTMSRAVQYSFMWRYNLDLYIVSRLASKLSIRLRQIHEVLVNPLRATHNNNDDPTTTADVVPVPYQSPMTLWDQVGLHGFLYKSLDDICDRYLVRTDMSFWQRYVIPGQGLFRQEVLNPVCMVTYHQNTTQVNAVAGLFAYLVSTDFDSAYSIVGGNTQLVASAWDQARDVHTSNCPDNNDDGEDRVNSTSRTTALSHVSKRISTVVGNSIEGFVLYDNEGTVIGNYDIVILAVPLSIAKIDFLIKSHIDETVLQPMPLGGLIVNSEDPHAVSSLAKDHEGHSPLPRQLPNAVTRPYVKATTTIVRKAVLQQEYWFPESGNTTTTIQKMMDGMKQQRWQIYMTAEGMVDEYNITAIHQLSTLPANVDEGCTYKIISSQALSLDALRKLFGPNVVIEFEYRSDTASPDYRGGKDGTASTEFLIYDGATGFHGHTRAGALYYPRAMELTVSNVETQAMGAKAVANLIAQRLGWFDTYKARFGVGDEL